MDVRQDSEAHADAESTRWLPRLPEPSWTSGPALRGVVGGGRRVGRSFAMTTNRCSPSSSKPDGRTDGLPPPSASADRAPRAARRRRSAPSRRRASRRSRAAATRTPRGPGASRRPAPQRGRSDSRWSRSLAEDLGAFRDDGRRCRSRGRTRSRAAHPPSSAPSHEQPVPLGAGQREHETRHATAGTKVDSCGRDAPGRQSAGGPTASRAGGGARPRPAR